MTPLRPSKNLVIVAALTLVYVIAGKLGLMLAFVHASATAVWPPTGIALVAFLLLGHRVWPAILLGAFVVNITTAGTVATSFGIATGNTLEGLVGAYLVRRFARGPDAFDHARDVFRFAVLTALVSTTVSATFGVTSLSLGGLSNWGDYGTVWWTWWLGDAAGALIVAPLLVLWVTNPRVRWSRSQKFEAALLLLLLIVASQAVFGGLLPIEVHDYPLDFLCVPMLVWAAFRFGPRETATAAFVLSTLALWGTLRGLGPFVRGTQNESLLLLQIFMGVTSVLALAFAALISERERAAREHKLTEDALRNSETRARVLFESASEGIVIVDRHGHIVLVNAKTEAMFGYARAELIGRPLEILVPERMRDVHARHRAGYSLDPRVRPMGQGLDLTGRGIDGNEFPVEISLSFAEEEGEPRFMAFVTDITQRKRVEEAAQRAEALHSVALLANAAAHEINNPLTAVMGYLQLIAQEMRANYSVLVKLTEALEAGERIQKIVARMQHMTSLHAADKAPNLPHMLDIRESSEDAD
jgi:PAS domain S-box-containing protein